MSDDKLLGQLVTDVQWIKEGFVASEKKTEARFDKIDKKLELLDRWQIKAGAVAAVVAWLATHIK